MLNWLLRTDNKTGFDGKHDHDMLASLMVMAWVVEARDPYTGGHLWRVSQYSRLLAEAGGMCSSEVAQTALGGFMHDLGKVAVNDAILNKHGPLTDGEYEVIKTHPEAGARMLAGHPLRSLVIDTIRLHHERPDGRGYPFGLGESDIPDSAAIVGICDAFDAMTSTRVYRQAMPCEKATAIIEKGLGTQFNERWGEYFIALAQAGCFDGIIGFSDQGIPLHDCLSCGPTIIQKASNKVGDKLYCRSCGQEVELAEAKGHKGLITIPTGKQGMPQDLIGDTDGDLINRIIEQSAVELHKAGITSVQQ
ncbi:HD-GYP domain-containing protein [Aliidiomarina sp. Khilg15.8]